ncbi:MAG: hypothetical protein ACRCUM_02630 [Mycoplasmoidaceae bacterium]
MNKKIKLSLLGTLIVGSALSITLPIVSCSSANQYLLTLIYAEGESKESLESIATESLQSLINLKGTEEEKINFINTWTRNSEVPSELSTEIFKIVSFNDINKNPIDVALAIEKVIFASETTPKTEEFDGPTIRIILNKDYTTKSPIDIKINKLTLKDSSSPFNTKILVK